MVGLLKNLARIVRPKRIEEITPTNSRIPAYQQDIDIYLETQNGKAFKIRAPGNNKLISISLKFADPLMEIKKNWEIAKECFNRYREMVSSDSREKEDPKNAQHPIYQQRRLISKEKFPSSRKKIGEIPVLGNTEINFTVPGRNPFSGECKLGFGIYANVLNDSFTFQQRVFQDVIHVEANKFDLAEEKLSKYGWRNYPCIRSDDEDTRLAGDFLNFLEKCIGDDKIVMMSIAPNTYDNPMNLKTAERLPNFRRIKSFERIERGHFPLLEITRIPLEMAGGETLPYGTQFQYGFDWKNKSVGLLTDRTKTGYVVKNLLTLTKTYNPPVELPEVIQDVEELRVM